MVYVAIILLFAGFVIFMASYVKTETARGPRQGMRWSEGRIRGRGCDSGSSPECTQGRQECYHPVG